MAKKYNYEDSWELTHGMFEIHWIKDRAKEIKIEGQTFFSDKPKKGVKMWALHNPEIGILSTHATKEDAENEKNMHGMFVYKIIPCEVLY